jgi:hypothetical protein
MNPKELFDLSGQVSIATEAPGMDGLEEDLKRLLRLKTSC